MGPDGHGDVPAGKYLIKHALFHASGGRPLAWGILSSLRGVRWCKDGHEPTNDMAVIGLDDAVAGHLDVEGFNLAHLLVYLKENSISGEDVEALYESSGRNSLTAQTALYAGLLGVLSPDEFRSGNHDGPQVTKTVSFTSGAVADLNIMEVEYGESVWQDEPEALIAMAKIEMEGSPWEH